MFSERQMKLIQLALIYTMTNLGDVIDAFRNDDGETEDGEEILLSVNGDQIHQPAEDEFEELLKLFQH